MARGKNYDAEHNLAAEWMCFFDTVPEKDWGVSLIRKELEGIDINNISLHNKPLIDYVLRGKNRHLALGIANSIFSKAIYFCKMHKMPVLQDHLNQYGPHKFCGIIQDLNDEKNTKDFKLNVAQEALLGEYLAIYQDVDWHIDVLRRTGLSLRGIGLYDVLVEGYQEGIIPFMIDAAKELEEWIEEEDANIFVRKPTHVKLLRKKLEEIEKREDLTFDEPEEIVEYIARELMGWIK